MLLTHFYPVFPVDPPLPLKTSENIWFSIFFGGVPKGSIGKKWGKIARKTNLFTKTLK